MLFSFLIASVSAGPTNTTGIGPSPSPMPISITNRCGVDGAIDHEFVVTLKPPPPTVEGDLELAALLRPPLNSGGRRLDTKDRLSFLQGWLHQYDTSNGTTRRKLEANSNSTHVLHLFTETQLAVAVSTNDDVRHAQHAPISIHPALRVASICSHADPRARTSDHRAHGQGPGRLLD